MWKYYSLLVIGIFISGFGWISGIRMSEASAVESVVNWSSSVKLVASIPTHYGKGVLYEDTGGRAFGVLQLKRVFGLFWCGEGAAGEFNPQQISPFSTVGRIDENNEHKEQFLVGVKVRDPNILYMALGFDKRTKSPTSNKTPLSLEYVRQQLNTYQLSKVKNGYVIFICDYYNESNFTFSAFDKTGRMIAEQRPAEEPRYVR